MSIVFLLIFLIDRHDSKLSFWVAKRHIDMSKIEFVHEDVFELKLDRKQKRALVFIFRKMDLSRKLFYRGITRSLKDDALSQYYICMRKGDAEIDSYTFWTRYPFELNYISIEGHRFISIERFFSEQEKEEMERLIPTWKKEKQDKND